MRHFHTTNRTWLTDFLRPSGTVIGFIAISLAAGVTLAQSEEFGGETQGEISSDDDSQSGEGQEQISAEAPETYTIKPGDTLWNLSAKFLNNPWYWPKVWSINPQIDNPNWVHPGSVIRFYKGPDEAPVQVEKVEDVPEELSTDDDEFVEEISTDSNLDDTVVQDDFADEEGPSFDGSKAKKALAAINSYSSLSIRKTIFVPNEKLKKAGRLENSPEEKTYLSTNDKVYVKLKEKHEPGTTLQVFRTVKKLSHPVKKTNLGEIVTLVGEVIVLTHSKGKSLGRVTSTWKPMHRGDYIAHLDEARVTMVERVPNSVEVKGYVVEATNDEKRLYEENVVVFVDKGESDGIKAGNVFTVVRSHDPVTGDTRGLTDEVIGKIIVSDVRSKSSAGILVYSNRSIVKGDRIEMRLDN